MNHLDKAKTALEYAHSFPVRDAKDMALVAIANALVAIAEREPKPEHIEDKPNSLADNGAERSKNGVIRHYELFGTPERAAQTFTKVCEECSATFRCRECPLYQIVGDNARESEFLEWLEGDA